MPLFNSKFLAPNVATSKRRVVSAQPSFGSVRPDVDDFLSSDLEHSFASTSLEDHMAASPASEQSDAMDISPVPNRIMKDVPHSKPIGRPRAFTSGARLFGTDRSNGLSPSPSTNGNTSKTSSSSAKRTQRAALPLEWMNPSKDENVFAPSSPIDDAMDVDSVVQEVSSPPIASFLQGPKSAATFTGLFYNTLSPRRSFESPLAERQPKKRRSASPDLGRSPESNNFSSPEHNIFESPSDRKIVGGSLFPRIPSKPSLQGMGNPATFRRPRRPALSAMVPPSDAPQSAYPILQSDESNESIMHEAAPPTRRAFSALVKAKPFLDQSSDDSFEDGGDFSSPAQDYAKRHAVKTIRRCDGTEDFRPRAGATNLVLTESPSAKYMSGGLPGFGDNEAYGKVLPCHRVKEDGLMRITPETMDDLLNGKYDAKIQRFQVVDCRFGYEFEGGHIPGAINVNSVNQLREQFFQPEWLPEKATLSCDSVKQTILVFHCEFSAKRAPTFAKTLRQMDRTDNGHFYPRIFWPEVYVLEGGYCAYFARSGHRCIPPNYIQMNDPNHAKSCEEDLSQFRKTKFGRHQSYTFGQGASGRQSMLAHSQQLKEQQSKQAKRNTAPPNSVFTPSAPRNRRMGSIANLLPLAEYTGDTDTEDEQQLGESPSAPPPTKTKRVLTRAATYEPRHF
ncbi:tyrosine phosphatase [Flagelloscypha sp. PMI_526]|nr:tyrosine phosphatase [Flagelloscypha sp. PMI_526]